MKNNLLPKWTENAVLIYGPRKSGTTLLLNLLDSAPGVLTFPDEVKLKRLLKERQLGKPETYYRHSLIFRNRYNNFNDVQYRRYTNKICKQTTSDLGLIIKKDIYGIFRNIKNKPKNLYYWAMKEVGGDTYKIIELFKALFPEGKIIFVVRNPLKTTRSVILDRRRKTIKLSFKQLIKEIKDPIRISKQQYKLFNSKKKNEDIFIARYEDLAGGKLKETMSKIATFLDISYSKAMERPTIFGSSVVVKTSSKKVKKVFNNITKWYESLSPKEVFFVCLISVSIRIKDKLRKISFLYYSYKKLRKLLSHKNEIN